MLKENGQMKLSLSPYQGLYDIVVPKEHLLRRIKENVQASNSTIKTATLNQIKVAVMKDAGKRDSKNTKSLRLPLDASRKTSVRYL